MPKEAMSDEMLNEILQEMREFARLTMNMVNRIPDIDSKYELNTEQMRLLLSEAMLVMIALNKLKDVQ